MKRHAALLGIGLVLVSCILCRGSAAVQPGTKQAEPWCLEDRLCKLSRPLTEGLESGNRIVVANIMPFGTGRYSLLAVYLARKLSAALHGACSDRLKVIDRSAGNMALVSEIDYTFDPLDPKELLKRFQADFAVVGTYSLSRDARQLELDVKVVRSFDAELIGSESCRIPGAGGEYEQWADLDRRIPPNISRKMVDFLVAGGDMRAIKSVTMKRPGGGVVSLRDTVWVGESVRIEVELNRPCHLQILGWDEDNALLSVLHPTSGESTAMPAGTFMLPRADGVFFEAQAPAGYNWVKVIATTEDVGLAAPDGGFLSSEAAQNAVADRILALGADGWGSESFTYEIAERR